MFVSRSVTSYICRAYSHVRTLSLGVPLNSHSNEFFLIARLLAGCLVDWLLCCLFIPPHSLPSPLPSPRLAPTTLPLPLPPFPFPPPSPLLSSSPLASSPALPSRLISLPLSSASPLSPLLPTYIHIVHYLLTYILSPLGLGGEMPREPAGRPLGCGRRYIYIYIYRERER